MGETREFDWNDLPETIAANGTPSEIAQALYELCPNLTMIVKAILTKWHDTDAIYEAISLFRKNSMYDLEVLESLAKFSYNRDAICERYDSHESDEDKQVVFSDLTGVLVGWKPYLEDIYGKSNDTNTLFLKYLNLLSTKGIEYREPINTAEHIANVLNEGDEE